MKAFGKFLGLGLLGLLLIIVALGFALTHLFDPNDYKDEIRQLARDKAHVELTLNGDIGWSLFPWLGLELHEASIATLNNPKVPFADLQLQYQNIKGEIDGADALIEGLKKDKPYLFGAPASSSTQQAPPNTPPEQKNAADMTDEEYAAARSRVIAGK